jgi:hypothetical protein
MESSMSKAGLDNRRRNKDGEISHKQGNTLIRTFFPSGSVRPSFATRFGAPQSLRASLCLWRYF